MSDDANEARETVKVIAGLVKDLGESPDAREATKNLGQSVVVLTKAFHNCLLPIAAVNFGFDKAREYFNQGKFERDFIDRTKDIPLEAVVDPKPSIVAPALQGLAFAHEEKSLRDMYLSLIAKSVDQRVAESSHPAFVEVIKQLTADEAVLLSSVLPLRRNMPVIEIRRREAKGRGSYTVIESHVINFHRKNASNLEEVPRREAYVENWRRLGLIEITYTAHLKIENYEWAPLRPEYLRARDQAGTDADLIHFEHGVLKVTAFGEQFAEVAGLNEVFLREHQREAESAS